MNQLRVIAAAVILLLGAVPGSAQQKTQAGIDAEITSQLPSGSTQGIPATALRQVLHDMNAGIFQGSSGVSGFATPTVAVGLTANSGLATTAMRSDASPALSQGISPTWTGQHAFANTTPSTSRITGAVTVIGGLGVSGAIFSGPLNVTGAVNTTGSIYSNSAPMQAAQRIPATVTAVANTDFTLNIPTGATVLGITVYTTTAFTGGTVALQAGNAVGDASYAVLQTIASQGVHVINLNPAGGAAQGNMPAGTPNYFMRITQGTPTAVGAATIVVDYLVP